MDTILVNNSHDRLIFRDRSASDAAMSVRVTDQGKDWQKRDDEAQGRHPSRAER
jgi:hypothetical protein